MQAPFILSFIENAKKQVYVPICYPICKQFVCRGYFWSRNL